MVWGNWNSAPYADRLRAGIDLSMSPGSVGSGTASVTIYWTLSGQTRYASWESGAGVTDWSISGTHSQSGSMNGWNEGAMGTWVVASGSFSVNTSFSSSVTVTVNAGYISGGAYDGAHPTVTGTITVPRRPYYVPESPAGVSATRNSDTQATVNWTRHASSSAPVTSCTVQRQTQTGDSWGPWETIGSPSGSWTSDGAMSYVASGLSANHKYSFQVRSNNTSGSSGFVEIGTDVYMTPGAPSSVSSSKDPSGNSITTTWVPTAYSSSTVTHQIERSVNGGAWGSVVTGIAQGTNSWQDNSPGAGTNKYRVAAKTSSGNLVSSYTEGNTVSTTVAPLAPTGLSPTGQSIDLTYDLILYWNHNEGGDGAPQTHYTIEKSSDGGGTWTALAGATDIASSEWHYHMTGGTLSNGTNYLWKVKTEGVVSAGYGPFSASATISGSALPVVTLQSGYPPASLSALPLEARWDYAQDQNSPQAEWEAVLLDSTGNTILETLSGSGTGSTATFAYPLVNGSDYLVRVRARSGAGLWGGYAEQAVSFDLLPPAPIDLTATYDMCLAVMNLALIPQDAEAGEVSADYAKIERRVAGGDWVTLTESVAVPVNFADPLPLTNGVNEYRVTSISQSPSYLVNAVVEAAGGDGVPGAKHWVLLSWGDGFGNTLRFQGNPKTGSRSGRRRAVQEFLGREDPVLLLGENRTSTVNASGDLRYDATCPVTDLAGCAYDSSVREWEEAGREAGVVCYRDYTGRRFFGMVSEVDANDTMWPGYGTLSFNVTKTAFTEGYV